MGRKKVVCNFCSNALRLGEQYSDLANGQEKSPDVANDYSLAHYQRGSLSYTNSSARLQILQTTFLLPISKGESYQPKF